MIEKHRLSQLYAYITQLIIIIGYILVKATVNLQKKSTKKKANKIKFSFVAILSHNYFYIEFRLYYCI
jgi:hypothetical protein